MQLTSCSDTFFYVPKRLLYKAKENESKKNLVTRSEIFKHATRSVKKYICTTQYLRIRLNESGHFHFAGLKDFNVIKI